MFPQITWALSNTGASAMRPAREHKPSEQQKRGPKALFFILLSLPLLSVSSL